MNKKKITSMFVAAVMLTQIFIPSALEIVKAALPKIKVENTNSGQWYLKYSNGQGQYNDAYMHYLDGKVAFCVEPDTDTIQSTETSTTHLTDPADIGLTQSDLDHMAVIAWYGYNGNSKTLENYIITQEAVWQYAEPISGTYYHPNGKNRLSQKEFEAKVDGLLANAKKFSAKPSFTTTIRQVDMGESLTLRDKNGVVSGLKVSKVSGGSARISGNEIILTPDGTSEKMTVSLNRGMYQGVSQEVFAVYAVRSGMKGQSVSTLTGKDDYSISLEVKVNLHGELEITKSDQYGKLIDGAKFKAVHNELGIEKTGTVVNGKLNIKEMRLGTWTLTETYSPEGYLINPQEFTVEIKPNSISEVTVENKEPKGRLSLKKEDSETGITPQGEGSLQGAEYTLYAAEDIYTKEGSTIFYSKDDVVAVRTTDDKGFMEDIDGLPMGKYYLQETKAPKGYLSDETKHEVIFTYEDMNTEVIVKDMKVEDKIKKMKVHIFKTGTEETGQMPELSGAEFTIKLKKDVDRAMEKGYSYGEIWKGIDEKGNVQNGINPVRIAEAQKIAPDRDVVTTNENGEAYSKPLPYGTYIGKETVTPKDYETAGDFKFTIFNDESEVSLEHKMINIYLNDKPVKAQVKMVKKDEVSGKLVSLNSAKFQIRAIEDIYDRSTGKLLWKSGDIVKQKVGGAWYDYFVTNSENNIGTFTGDNGTVFTALPLEPGKYQIEEIEEPEGYLALKEPVKFEIDGIKDYTQDKDGDFTFEVVVKNYQPKGEIELIKKIEDDKDSDALAFDVSNTDMSCIKFGLYAREDIIDMADGSIVHKKGDTIGEYNLNKDGTLTISDLWLGKYEIKELETLPELVLDDSAYDIDILKYDDTTKVISVGKEITNKITRTEISKVDKEGKNIAGAKMLLQDKESKEIIAQWISGEKPFVISGLERGKTYILSEQEAPDGYVLSKDAVEVVVDKEGNTSEVEFKNIQVKFIKENLAGTNLKGGIFAILDKDGKELYRIQASKDGVVLTGLVKGEEYAIKEIKAPDGYVKADKPVKFKITGEDNQEVKMKNKGITIIKTFDGFPLTAVLILIAASAAGCIAFAVERGKKEEDNEFHS